MRGGWLRVAVPACLLLAVAAVPATAQTDSESLALLGQSDLGGAGVNGDVAVVDDVAIVGAGVVGHTGYHTERFSPGPCLEVTAKVVDLRDPKRPRVASTIPMPPGVAAIEVDAARVETASFTGILAAIALDDNPSHSAQTACTPNERNPFFTDRGVVYYDITRPAEPKLLGRYMADQGPQDDVPSNALPCGPPPGGAAVRCATGQHSVSLAVRDDGRVLSISVEPVADLLVKPSGDVRVVDVTDPTRPQQLGAWPPLGQRPPSGSTNGCTAFSNSHAASFYEGGRRALVAFMDGGLFDLNLGNATTPNSASQFTYPNERTEEANAGYASAATVDGVTLAALSEESWYPSTTSLRIDGPAAVAGAKFACQALPVMFDLGDKAQLWKRPSGTISGDIVYGGRGCPARGTAANPVAEDPYPTDPRGKIVLLDTQRIPATQPTLPQNACNVATRISRAQNAGALAVLFNRIPLAPFTPSPQALAWGAVTEPITIPALLLDEPDAAALRTALCPGVADGQCNPGEPMTGGVVDAPGQWGGLRILEVDPDTGMRQLAVFRSPRASTFPPPDLGVYAPGRSVALGHLLYVAWHADGLRVVDLSQQPPEEVGHFVPPDTPDPAKLFPAKADVVGVAVSNELVLVSDQNSGLYVLDRGGGDGGFPVLALGAVLGGIAAAVAIVSLSVRRRRRGV